MVLEETAQLIYTVIVSCLNSWIYYEAISPGERFIRKQQLLFMFRFYLIFTRTSSREIVRGQMHSGARQPGRAPLDCLASMLQPGVSPCDKGDVPSKPGTRTTGPIENILIGPTRVGPSLFQPAPGTAQNWKWRVREGQKRQMSVPSSRGTFNRAAQGTC